MTIQNCVSEMRCAKGAHTKRPMYKYVHDAECTQT